LQTSAVSDYTMPEYCLLLLWPEERDSIEVSQQFYLEESWQGGKSLVSRVMLQGLPCHSTGGNIQRPYRSSHQLPPSCNFNAYLTRVFLNEHHELVLSE
jgi:hypothetical protein